MVRITRPLRSWAGRNGTTRGPHGGSTTGCRSLRETLRPLPCPSYSPRRRAPAPRPKRPCGKRASPKPPAKTWKVSPSRSPVISPRCRCRSFAGFRTRRGIAITLAGRLVQRSQPLRDWPSGPWKQAGGGPQPRKNTHLGSPVGPPERTGRSPFFGNTRANGGNSQAIRQVRLKAAPSSAELLYWSRGGSTGS